jgi:voltage-gated potassium channel
MRGFAKNNNFFILLAGLVAFLLLTPILQVYAHDSVKLLILWGLCLTLLIQVWSLIENIVLFRFGMSLTILSFFLTGIGEFYLEIAFIQLMSTVIFLIFFCLALVIAAKEVFSRASISANTFAGALSIYLLLGLIWTLLYSLVFQIEPNAFKGIEAEGASGELIYFSYITLTSLGYGDVVALTPITRTLTFIEVIVGQFYMAVLVGALVGKYIAHHQINKTDD